MFCLQRHGSHHIAAHAVTDQTQTATVHANFLTVLGYPFCRFKGLMNGHREMGLR